MALQISITKTTADWPRRNSGHYGVRLDVVNHESAGPYYSPITYYHPLSDGNPHTDPYVGTEYRGPPLCCEG
jgi:hypothetical protein